MIEDILFDWMYYFDVFVEVGLVRIVVNKGCEVNCLDKEDIIYYEKVEVGYEKVINMFLECFM